MTENKTIMASRVDRWGRTGCPQTDDLKQIVREELRRLGKKVRRIELVEHNPPPFRMGERRINWYNRNWAGRATDLGYFEVKQQLIGGPKVFLINDTEIYESVGLA